MTIRPLRETPTGDFSRIQKTIWLSGLLAVASWVGYVVAGMVA